MSTACLRKITTAMLVSLCIFAPTAQAELTLRDAMYLYNQDITAGGRYGIYGADCDVFQLVFDVTSGYSDLIIWELDADNLQWNSRRYADKILAAHDMFSYMLYSSAVEKGFDFDDRSATWSASSAKSVVGKATIFGYCLSTNPNAYVYYYDYAKCQYKYSDGTTENDYYCTPIL